MSTQLPGGWIRRRKFQSGFEMEEGNVGLLMAILSTTRPVHKYVWFRELEVLGGRLLWEFLFVLDC